MAKMVTKICNVISAVMVMIIAAIGAVMIIPKLTGDDIYAVMSGSMEPTYHVGSVVIVDKDVKPEEIEIGDSITFHLTNGEIATHRVIAVDEDARTFRTKGDANETEDVAPVSFEAMIGRAGMTVPYIGYLPLYMRTPKGMFCIGAYVAVFILLQIITELLKTDEPGKEERLDE